MPLIALQGCIHGEIDRTFEAVKAYEDARGSKVSVLLWSGDVQTTRDNEDLDTLACPPKYRAMKDFPDYYSGRKIARRLAVFTGGNHESSRYLNLLYFGGWVAPNIFYLGRSGVVTIGGCRIAGLSGIYNYHNFSRGYFESEPFDEDTCRSVYHVRRFEIEKLAGLSHVDLLTTHDWPTQIVAKQEDRDKLIQYKPFFKSDLERGSLGNPQTNRLLYDLKPRWWVAAHLHVNFSVDFQHDENHTTTFIAHDKPKRFVSMSMLDTDTKHLDFLVRGNQESSSPSDDIISPDILIDLEWLCILKMSMKHLPVGDDNQTQHYCDCHRHQGLLAATPPCRPTWNVCCQVAKCVDAKMQTDWLNRLSPPDDLTTLVPLDVPLHSFTVAYPKEFASPEVQTAWWLSLIDESVSPLQKVMYSQIKNPLL